jgi:hypothetical protein
MAARKPAGSSGSGRSRKPKGADGPTMTEEFFKEVGGSVRTLKRQAWSTPTAFTQGGTDEVWDFGWIPEEARDEVVHQAHERATQAHVLPKLVITGAPNADVYDAVVVNLCTTWKHPDVIKVNGGEFTGTHQLTGSCVGAGGGNMWNTLAFQEAVIKGELEIPKATFWLLPYGRSRFRCGMKTPGEGSLGSCFAEAAIEDGTLDFDRQGLPQPVDRSDGWIWGRNVELKWSDGDAQDTMNLLPESRKYLIKTAAKCRDANDVWDALTNGYPCTAASMYAHDGGKVTGSGKDACLLARKQGSWSHQMSVLARWLHPQHGRLFWLMNQWGLRAHGICPSGMPPGGVWITEADMTWICRDEVYAFSAYNGFPAPSPGPIPWIV